MERHVSSRFATQICPLELLLLSGRALFLALFLAERKLLTPSRSTKAL
jgi:hypothetical protein